MIRPITFEEQVVGSKTDGGVYRNIYPHDGILRGCDVTTTSTQIEIDSGMFVLCGRMIYVDGKTTFEMENPIQNGYARLKAKIDLNEPSTQEECGQFTTIVEFSTTELFEELLQEDINKDGKIYEQELAVVKIESKNIIGIVRKLSNGGVDAERLGGQLPSEYVQKRAPDVKTNVGATATLTVDDSRVWTDGVNVYVYVQVHHNTTDGIGMGDQVANIYATGVPMPSKNMTVSGVKAAKNDNTLIFANATLMPNGALQMAVYGGIKCRYVYFDFCYPIGI